MVLCRRFSGCNALVVVSVALLLAGCAGTRPPAVTGAGEGSRRTNAPNTSPPAPALPAAGSGRGGYYQDDGPGASPPPDLQAIPDADPKIEPYGKRGNRPYVVFGKTYTPITDDRPLKQRGVGSWYGKKFHGQKTSSGELYDMYKMTAAHPTLPLPSYARVTNVASGAQVIVRVNDRGPFHSGRIIDLSYTAALKLGYLGRGSSELEVERLLPDEIARLNSGQGADAPATAVAIKTVDSVTAPPVVLSMEDFLASQQRQEQQEQPPPMPLPAQALQPDLSASSSSSGYYLQFGAFSQVANADTMRERLTQAWPPALPPLATQQRGAVYRLYSGPFETRDEALRAAALLADNPLARPLIVQP